MSSWLTGLCASIGAAFGIVEEHSDLANEGCIFLTDFHLASDPSLSLQPLAVSFG